MYVHTLCVQHTVYTGACIYVYAYARRPHQTHARTHTHTHTDAVQKDRARRSAVLDTERPLQNMRACMYIYAHARTPHTHTHTHTHVQTHFYADAVQ